MKNKLLSIDNTCLAITLRKLPTPLRSDIIKAKLHFRWSLNAKWKLIHRENEVSRYQLPVSLKYNLTFPDMLQQGSLNVDIRELKATSVDVEHSILYCHLLLILRYHGDVPNLRGCFRNKIP